MWILVTFWACLGPQKCAESLKIIIINLRNTIYLIRYYIFEVARGFRGYPTDLRCFTATGWKYRIFVVLKVGGLLGKWSHTIKPTRSQTFWIYWWNFGDCWHCTFLFSPYRINLSNLKFGLCHVETFIMKSCIEISRILNALAVAALHGLMFRHKTGSVYMSNVHGLIWPKLLMFDKSPGPKTSACQYWLILIAPPTGNRKLQIS